MSVGKRTDMKTLIVFNHPHEGSYCTSILHAAEKGLKAGGHPCRIINLDKDGFDPVMRSKDLKAFAMAGKDMDDALLEVDPLVMKYKEDLEWAVECSKRVSRRCRLYLQPEWSVYDNIVPIIVEWVKSNPEWNISIQAHKFMRIP